MIQIPFQVTDWKLLPARRVEGKSGYAEVKTVDLGAIQMREIAYSARYEADHWCSLGHIAYCLSGALELKLSDGSSHLLEAGMSFQVSDGLSSHWAASGGGARLVILDGDFLR